LSERRGSLQKDIVETTLEGKRVLDNYGFMDNNI